MKRILLLLALSLSLVPLRAYENPILPYDFSDPDVIRLGKYYYMTYSTFASTPGLQILRSEDDAFFLQFCAEQYPATVIWTPALPVAACGRLLSVSTKGGSISITAIRI